MPEIIKAVHARLQGVQIESLPYEQILERYDRPTTLFYLDPPYWRRKLYRFNFSDDDFRALEARLHGIRGRFILSLDDHPDVRKLFANWRLERTEIAYTARTNAGKRYGELLILNFDPASKPSAAESAQEKRADQ
ncbi:MAG: DNA adenine methylase [Planctomycetes bacterium]|nr:DNA adenine methylase [Planctomycetota bacterium]